MLPVGLRVKQLEMNLVYNRIDNRATRYLSDYINVTCKQHGINTCLYMCRMLNNLVKHRFTTQEYKHGINCHTLVTIQSVQNMSQFRCLVKQFLFNHLNDQEANSFTYFKM